MSEAESRCAGRKFRQRGPVRNYTRIDWRLPVHVRRQRDIFENSVVPLYGWEPSYQPVSAGKEKGKKRVLTTTSMADSTLPSTAHRNIHSQNMD